MDSLNSTVPLRIDKDGKINIEEHPGKALRSKNDANHAKRSDDDGSNVWCGQEILSKLSSLRNVCFFNKQIILIISPYLYSLCSKKIILKIIQSNSYKMSLFVTFNFYIAR